MNDKIKPGLPNFHDQYIETEGDVSLSLALFRLAPPASALKMIQDRVIKDLDELTDDGVSLLAVKYFQQNHYPFHLATKINPNPLSMHIPLWEEWQDNADSVWKIIENDNPNFSIDARVLVASMMYSGADPWVEWDCQHLDNVSSSFFHMAFIRKDIEMVSLLFSHPNCPDVDYFEKQLLHGNHINSESRHHVRLNDTPLMHFAVNSSNIQLVDLLLSKGMDINKRDELGRTPIFYARDKDMAQHIIDKGAKISTQDDDGVGLSIFWRKWFATAAKLADFSKVLITHMKKHMSADEVRDVQKPTLFSELYEGTKGGFEAIFKKSKFSNDVIFDMGKRGKWDVITTAILRSDDKSEMFLKWGLDRGLLLSHKPFIGSDTDNGILGMIVGCGGDQYFSDYLKEKYSEIEGKDILPTFAKDMICGSVELSKINLKPQVAATTLLSILLFEERQKIYSSHNAYRNTDKNIKRFESVINYLYPKINYINTKNSKPFGIDIKADDFSIDATKIVLNAYIKNFNKMFAENRGNYYSGALLDDNDLKIFIDIMKSEIKDGNPRWVEVLPHLFSITFASSQNRLDLNYYESPTVGSDVRSTICDLLSSYSFDQLGLDSEHLSNIREMLGFEEMSGETNQKFRVQLDAMEIRSGMGNLPSLGIVRKKKM